MNKPLLRNLFLTAILSVFGIAGNALTLPVSFGVMFIFGSIFSVIAVSRIMNASWRQREKVANNTKFGYY